MRFRADFRKNLTATRTESRNGRLGEIFHPETVRRCPPGLDGRRPAGGAARLSDPFQRPHSGAGRGEQRGLGEGGGEGAGGAEGAGPLLGEGRRGPRAAQPASETSDRLPGSSSRAACCSSLRAAASRPAPRGRGREGCRRAGGLPPSPLPARSQSPASPGARAPARHPCAPARAETPGAERR